MRIGVVGLGLIGGSLAGALARAGHSVIGCDRERTIEMRALSAGHLESTTTEETLARDSEVVILCTPIEETLDLVARIGPLMSKDCVLTDVASVKRPVVAAMNQVVSGPRCVGGHPMAGKAVGGIDSADANLFRGAVYALVRSDNTDQRAINVMMELAQDLGARPMEIGAEEHDRQVALTSHLVQILSSTLSVALNGGEGFDLKGPGLEGMLRLAASDERLWSEILERNSDYVQEAAGTFLTQLDEILDEIRVGDRDGIQAFLAAGRAALS